MNPALRTARYKKRWSCHGSGEVGHKEKDCLRRNKLLQKGDGGKMKGLRPASVVAQYPVYRSYAKQEQQQPVVTITPP